jgi:hypothetical protein
MPSRGRCAADAALQVFNGSRSSSAFPTTTPAGACWRKRRAADRRGAPEGTLVDRRFPVEPTSLHDAARAPPSPPAEPAPVPPLRARRHESAPQRARATLEVEPLEPPSRAWRFGVALLTMVLAVEPLTPIAVRSRSATRSCARPESVCLRVGCSVPYSATTRSMLDESELLGPGKPNETRWARASDLASVARVSASRLTLTDLTGQRPAARVASDRLPRTPGRIRRGHPAGHRVALQLRSRRRG